MTVIPSLRGISGFSTKPCFGDPSQAPKEVRHPEHREGSPAIDIVPYHGDPSLLVRDDVLLLRCFPQRGWATRDDVK